MMASLRSSLKFEQDEDGTIQAEIGFTNWKDQDLEVNVKEFVKAVQQVKPPKQDADKFIQAVSLYCKYTPAILLPKKPFRVTK